MQKQGREWAKQDIIETDFIGLSLIKVGLFFQDYLNVYSVFLWFHVLTLVKVI